MRCRSMASVKGQKKCEMGVGEKAFEAHSIHVSMYTIIVPFDYVLSKGERTRFP